MKDDPGWRIILDSRINQPRNMVYYDKFLIVEIQILYINYYIYYLIVYIIL